MCGGGIHSYMDNSATTHIRHLTQFPMTQESNEFKPTKTVHSFVEVRFELFFFIDASVYDCILDVIIIRFEGLNIKTFNNNKTTFFLLLMTSGLKNLHVMHLLQCVCNRENPFSLPINRAWKRLNIMETNIWCVL